MDPYDLHRRPTLSIAGGAVYQARSFILTRPVQDSFGMVRVPGVKGVRVFASNQLIGKTDARGNLLVPSLLSYYGNQVRIEDKDIPIDFDVRAVEKTVAPPFRGGAFIPFPVSRIQTIGGSVTVIDNGAAIVPAYGQLTISSKAGTFISPVGVAGEFYLENVPAGKYDAVIQHDNGECKFSLTIPETLEPVVLLGELRCTAETK
jgi:outer membrane usher protein